YEDVWAAGAKKNFGIHGTEWYHGIDTPAAKAFVATYKKMFPSALIPVPTQDTVNGYIGLRELLKAIQRAGKEEVTPVIKTLEGYTIPAAESPKNDPILIRDWDHQFVWAYYVVRSKKEKDMKDRTDFFELLKWCPGKDVARTKEENPVKLEDYPA
ncbi:MAG TPA: ABC transporter substrate-binding protein, partial [Thermodesulfobacteriota bacterium]|nr:ABC transporter substrate-binding protein [Thermodesulfobacteriota bacterium]